MGRGIARKIELTRKCTCDSPHWDKAFVEVNGRTNEISYVLHCRSCRTHWSTKSHNARKYWESEMDRVPITWMGYGYNGKQTVRELFDGLDEDRLEYLVGEAEACDRILREAQKKAEKAHMAVEKYKQMMEEF